MIYNPPSAHKEMAIDNQVPELIWNQQIPVLSNCFEWTVLSALPCIFLFIFGPCEVLRIKSLPNQPTPWTLINIPKLCLSTLLIVLCSVQLFYIFLADTDEHFDIAQVISLILEIISFVVIFLLTLYQRKKNVHTSAVLFTFWLFFSVFDLISFALHVAHAFSSHVIVDDRYRRPNGFEFIVKTLHTAFVVSSFLLNCVSDYKAKDGLKSCPNNRASFLSTLTFWWVNSLISFGKKNTLTESDIWQLNDEFETRTVYRRFLKRYERDFRRFKQAKQDAERRKRLEKELDKSKAQGKANQVNIIYPFLRTFKFELLHVAIFKLISVLFGFAQPILLDLIMAYIRSEDPVQWKGYFYAAGMLVCSAIESLLNNRYEIGINQIAMKFKSALTLIIYKKSLVLSSSGRKNFTTGEIVNLMSLDIQKIVDYLLIVNQAWSATLQIVISTILIWRQLGLATIAGIGVMLFMFLPNSLITNQLEVQQVKQMANKDGRTKTLNEALSGIKVLKLYHWSSAFLQRIAGYRAKEVASLRMIMIMFALRVFSFNVAPFLCTLASFLTYVFVYEDQRLDAAKIFVSVSLFGIIRMPLGTVPFIVTNGLIALVSIRRISKYLSADELEEKQCEGADDREYPVQMEDASFRWSDQEPDATLKQLSFKVKKNSLVAVVGRVGSGKSSLLSAILSEMTKTNGKLVVPDSIAYVSQVAWIQNATVKENILFAEPFDRRRYEDILDRAQLRPDLNLLPGGDECEIGEKGINLSGGQKQRVNLARAAYSNKSTYLFDDPLSALDSNVSAKVFDEIIGNRGLLRDKTRLLVTHRLSLLKSTDIDYILVMKDGRISEQGTYDELMAKQGEFSELVLQFLSETNNHQETDTPAAEDKRPNLERASRKSIDSASAGQAAEDLKRTRTKSVVSRSSIKATIDKTVETSEKRAAEGKLIERERLEVGSVKRSVYWAYIRALGIHWYSLVIVSYLISHSFNLASQLSLASFADESADLANYNSTQSGSQGLLGYAALGSSELIFVLLSTVVLCLSCLDAARKIHNRMLRNVFSAPMAFFDTTPLGRLVNRFSKDLDTADNAIYNSVRGVVLYNFRMLATFTLITIESPWFLAAVLPIIAFYFAIQKFYVATSRQLKRLESTTRSPIYSHFSETIAGASSIRAYQMTDRFVGECCRRVDANHRIHFANINAVRWLSVRLEFLGYSIVFLTGLFAVLFRDRLRWSPGLVGVSVTSALTITSNLGYLIKAFTDLETDLVAVERCLEYTKLDSERPDEMPENKPSSEWPSRGVIKFENYSTKYRPELDLVLKSISFTVGEGEKVGIVGRTGSGKSTCTLALFRIIESVTGRILIDDVDISQIGLREIRSKLSIIPQDPILFTGTIRFNLDPYEAHSDEEIWKSLEQAHLKSFVAGLEGGLAHEVSEGGDNLSVGQRQLVCLARALLRRSKILVLDEATAACDFETDELIQKTIRSAFAESTILTIAHRLDTIIDYDKVLVLDQGRIAEYDRPQNLLKNKKTIFYSMAKDSGLV